MDYKGFKELLESCINDKSEEFPAELDNLIADTARTGIVRLPWELLKPLFNYRLQKVFGTSFEELELEGEDKAFAQQLLNQLNKFDNPPFTIQRICELIVDPKRNYKRRDKYMRAIERCLLVVSTQEPDLTWMKSPRLTQLLEEPPRESLQEVVFDENMVNEFSAAPATGEVGGGVWSNLRHVSDDNEQPFSPSESDRINKAVKPVNPVLKDEKGEKDGEQEVETSTSSTEERAEDKEKRSTSSRLCALLDDSSDNTPESSSNSPEREGIENKSTEGVQEVPVSRKRSRESLDRSSGGGAGGEGGGGGSHGGTRDEEENDRGTVLQEADSTTLGEQEDSAQEEGIGDVEMEREGGEAKEEEEEDRDLEQSTLKKMRSHSPEVEAEPSKVEGASGGGVDVRDTSSGLDAAVPGGEADMTETPPDKESESKRLLLKTALQSGLKEKEEEENSVGDQELHSCSERETSTGQLVERSHSDLTTASVDEMETS